MNFVKKEVNNMILLALFIIGLFFIIFFKIEMELFLAFCLSCVLGLVSYFFVTLFIVSPLLSSPVLNMVVFENTKTLDLMPDADDVYLTENVGQGLGYYSYYDNENNKKNITINDINQIVIDKFERPRIEVFSCRFNRGWYRVVIFAFKEKHDRDLIFLKEEKNIKILKVIHRNRKS